MQFGNSTLRLTTRQAYQLHGVLKKDLKTVFSTVIKNMGSTLAACGDVNRNVMGPSPPYKNRPDYMHAVKMANDIADLLAPQSGAYYDVWLDGEKFVSVYKEVRYTGNMAACMVTVSSAWWQCSRRCPLASMQLCDTSLVALSWQRKHVGHENVCLA